jgi:asparagine synthase (glutamine-hydrolysing)
LRTEHTELILSPSDARGVIPDLLDYFDEPFADSSAIPTYYVSRLAREHVTVSLSGDGGDELFGGYPWRQVRPRYQRLLSRLPLPLRAGIRRLGGLLPAGLPGRNFLCRADMPYARYILDAIAVFDDEDRRRLYGPLFDGAIAGSDSYRHHLPHLDRGAGRSWTARMMEYDLKTYLPNDILTKVDRMSMYTSLEARVPLLDHRLVELAAAIPSRLKIRGGVAKHILKRVMAPYLPASVLGKRKHGFSVPLETWLRTELREEVLDTLRSGNRHGLFSRDGLDRLTDSFFHGDDRRNHQVWTLYAFERWHRAVHLGGRPAAAASGTCRG